MLENLKGIHIDLISASAVMMGMLILLLFAQAYRRGLSCLDLITDKGTNRISLTKTMNLLGGCVGAWCIMQLAIKSDLDLGLFVAYLMYCAGTHSFSTWLSARYRLPDGPTEIAGVPAQDRRSP